MTASAERSFSPLRFGLRLAALAFLFLFYVPPHLVSRRLLRGSRWPQRFLRHAALIIGVRPRIEGRSLTPRSLIIANHVSWLDILVLGGWTGTAFVAKEELRLTPLIGWIADQNRTLYIDRSARRNSHEQVRRIADALHHPQPLTLFPEGTTGCGRRLLPFRSTLMEAVIPVAATVTVRPVALDYGELAGLVGWHGGEPGLANFRRLLGHRGRIPVTIRLLDPLQRAQDRKTLAALARRSIESALSSLTARDSL